MRVNALSACRRACQALIARRVGRPSDDDEDDDEREREADLEQAAAFALPLAQLGVEWKVVRHFGKAEKLKR